MGLGKTCQAIAAMAHLTATNHTHFFVVCPASVMANWEREIAKLSALTSHRVHGNGTRDSALETWVDRGRRRDHDLRHAADPGRAARRRSRCWSSTRRTTSRTPGRSAPRTCWPCIRQAGRVILLSGTPLENRVAEFTTLVGYLRPDLVAELEASDEHNDEQSFRKLLAPAYLRRNQRDVLKELPEMVPVDEWVEFSNGDRDRVPEGGRGRPHHADAPRRVPTAKDSAKLRRLIEIVDESRENGLKVLIFSYFRDVLDMVEQALGDRVVGHITGNTPPPDPADAGRRVHRDRGPRGAAVARSRRAAPA